MRAEQVFFSVRAQHILCLPETKILNTPKATSAQEIAPIFYKLSFFFIQKLIAICISRYYVGTRKCQNVFKSRSQRFCSKKWNKKVEMRSVCGQFNRECCALSFFTFRFDAAAASLNKLFTYRQSQPLPLSLGCKE